MDTTTSLEHHKKESTPKDEDEISSPKLVQWDTSPLTSEADTGSEAALIQFDDIDSKLLPLPKVSSIPSSESSNLSDYMQDKVQGSEEGATSIPHLDPNLLRVKKTEAGGSSFESRSSVSVSPHPGFYIGKTIHHFKWKERKTNFIVAMPDLAWHDMSLVIRKPVFGVCDQVRHKPSCAATEARWRLEISDIETRSIILSRQWTTKVLIRLFGCAGWSAPLLFAYGINRFSHDMVHITYHLSQ